MGRQGNLAFGLVVFLCACGGKNLETPDQTPPPAAPETPPERVPDAEVQASLELEITRLRRDLAETRTSLGANHEQRMQLERALSERAEELAVLEESNASLELELASALDALLRAQASLRNVQSRAFAVSRIAEVRVQLEAARRHHDEALNARIDRSAEFLERADQTLSENNIGGAAYLADRAGELLRQAQTVAEIRGKDPREIIPIVPARSMEVQAAANLRRDPSSESPRLDGIESGTQVEAIARQGDWFQIVTAAGTTAWIHRALVR